MYAAAAKLSELGKSGKVDEKTVAQLEKRAGDAEFATSLMYALGTERFRHLMAALVYQKDAKKQRTQAALGKAQCQARISGCGFRDSPSTPSRDRATARPWETAPSAPNALTEREGLAQLVRRGSVDHVAKLFVRL